MQNDSLFVDAESQSFVLFFLSNGSANQSELLTGKSVEPLAAGAETGARAIRLDLPNQEHPV
ncbi:hypothetical protein RSSM_01517 [Rhodopirellula sallentina SM41]|uniref:Uncharacterized protein n=1 Tax=Rhodopirellula sallentina SM41 TaxID=1263870 RepID=M5UM09_9BACT|nr:hypothetical protein RSSM_01517 [Rhodopirellula sallentina SM41]